MGPLAAQFCVFVSSVIFGLSWSDGFGEGFAHTSCGITTAIGRKKKVTMALTEGKDAGDLELAVVFPGKGRGMTSATSAASPKTASPKTTPVKLKDDAWLEVKKKKVNNPQPQKDFRLAGGFLPGRRRTALVTREALCESPQFPPNLPRD